ncbi:murein L,D-transpeptidase catalytic domain family protein [Microvirga sp. STR05]|uniref:Murein L,D-transpeptidase catalytic domain family protein n=1 Tax=Hymenobacter duratus TaxID=2771356 RepID=A0ABR8JGH4_9BACT|nr:murein L,D-transpeptidase catalytic domain family protein [Hymenobacter duratus]MBD2714467.1 murein L,D-transpeptidase catalytic domain family protein [Hymenobacter duratus]MBR7949371.1 murein L,D-transpeptidase catalytic domain family protein [Microvirga sp. STR05]
MRTEPGFWGKKWRQLAVAAVGLGLAGCNVSASENNAAAPNSSQLGPAPTDTAVPTATPLPDSLALTPVAPLPALPDSVRQAVQLLHKQLGPEAAALRPEVLERACVGYLALRQEGRIQQGGVLAVADMDLPSSEKRLWVLDLRQGRVLHRSHVAHGRGSGKLRARRFSNTIKSACTALGFYRTQDTYGGKHGLSRRLRGLDAGQNDNALRRYVVLHAADYVSRQHLQRHGQAGYSRGCPALPPDQYRAIINSLPEGACLLLAGPGLESKWLDGAAAARQLAARGWR